ncbi:MAG: hypothetical protein EH225_03390 [Calditrichaeota bacterium]|nr:MAG: hypothetical protein EH225_03390 [Calditrichota bacterium]
MKRFLYAVVSDCPGSHITEFQWVDGCVKNHPDLLENLGEHTDVTGTWHTPGMWFPVDCMAMLLQGDYRNDPI